MIQEKNGTPGARTYLIFILNPLNDREPAASISGESYAHIRDDKSFLLQRADRCRGLVFPTPRSGQFGTALEGQIRRAQGTVPAVDSGNPQPDLILKSP